MKKYGCRSSGKIDLYLGNACIEVNQYKKAKRETLPSLKKLNSATKNRLKQKRSYYEVKEDGTLYEDGPELDPENLAKV